MHPHTCIATPGQVHELLLLMPGRVCKGQVKFMTASIDAASRLSRVFISFIELSSVAEYQKQACLLQSGMAQ